MYFVVLTYIYERERERERERVGYWFIESFRFQSSTSQHIYFAFPPHHRVDGCLRFFLLLFSSSMSAATDSLGITLVCTSNGWLFSDYSAD